MCLLLSDLCHISRPPPDGKGRWFRAGFSLFLRYSGESPSGSARFSVPFVTVPLREKVRVVSWSCSPGGRKQGGSL